MKKKLQKFPICPCCHSEKYKSEMKTCMAVLEKDLAEKYNKKEDVLPNFINAPLSRTGKYPNAEFYLVSKSGLF